MNEKDFKKYEKEFIKTPFGKRTKIISIAPFIIGILFIIAFAIDGIILDEEMFLSTHIICWTICLIGGCITQLIYGYALKDFIKSKK